MICKIMSSLGMYVAGAYSVLALIIAQSDLARAGLCMAAALGYATCSCIFLAKLQEKN